MTETTPQRRPLGTELENDAKRFKANDKENGSIIDLTADPPKPLTDDIVKNMLKLDPGTLVGSNKTDDAVLAQLRAFADGLQTHIKLVDEERAKAKAEKARLHKEKEEEIRRAKRQKEEEIRHAKRQALVDSNKCFSCEKVCATFSECSCFKEDGALGNGSRCCNDCNDKNENLQCCVVCSAKIDEGCCDYQKCAGCGEAHICIYCSEEDSWVDCGYCCERFCSDCNDEFAGCGCGGEEFCESCAGKLEKCHCGTRVCDKCKKTPECRRDVVLCHDCDCVDCDDCEFLSHQRSRWW